MKRIIFGSLLFLAGISAASAQESCDSKAPTVTYDYEAACGKSYRVSTKGSNVSGGNCGGGVEDDRYVGPTTGSGWASTFFPSGSGEGTVPAPPPAPTPVNICTIGGGVPNDANLGGSTYNPNGGCQKQRCDGTGDSGGNHNTSDPVLNIPKFNVPVHFQVTYQSRQYAYGKMSFGWRHNFESRIDRRLVARLYVGGEGGWQLPNKVCASSCAIAGYSDPMNLDGQLAEVHVLEAPDSRRIIYGGGTPIGDGAVKYTGPTHESGTLVVRNGKYYWSTPDGMIYVYDWASGWLERIVDRSANELTLYYSDENLYQVTDPDGRVIYTFEYDSVGHLYTVTDIGGRKYTFLYNPAGRLISYEDPESRTTFEYQDYTVPGLAKFAGGHFSGSSMETMPLLSRINSQDGSYVAYTYGPEQYMVDHSSTGLTGGSVSADNPFSGPLVPGVATPQPNAYTVVLEPFGDGFRVDPIYFGKWHFPNRFYTIAEERNGARTSFEYTVDEKLAVGRTKITLPLGQVHTRVWRLESGAAQGESSTSPAGTVKTAYDSQLNPVRIEDEAGRVTLMAYDSKNRVVSVTNPLNQTRRITYNDTANKPASVTDEKGNTTRYSYDTRGRLVSITNGANEITTYAYNGNGVLTSITDFAGHTTTFVRGNYGLLTSVSDALGHGVSMGYDSIGRAVSVTDALNKTYFTAYNPDDSVATRTDPLSGVTAYSYGTAGFGQQKPLRTLTDANTRTTTFNFDSYGRPIGMSDPLGRSHSYSYNLMGGIAQATDANGNTFSYNYDQLSRLTDISGPDGVAGYAYDKAGNMTSAEDSQSRIQLGYDKLGRAIASAMTDKGSGLSGGLNYGYDAAGNRTSMTLPASPQAYNWSYGYDAANRPTSITAPDGTQFAFTYDAAGRRTRTTYGSVLEVNYGYDDADRLTSMSYMRVDGMGRQFLDTLHYTYDAAGNRTAMTDHVGTHSFAYDDLQRLTAASHPAPSAFLVQNESFTYDAVGNRLGDALRTDYAYNGGHQLTADSAYTYGYDNNGNLTTRTNKASSITANYTYDSQNRLRQAVTEGGITATYRYDVMGRRIAKTVSGGEAVPGFSGSVRYIYDNSDAVGLVDSNNSIAAVITHGPGVDEPLMIATGGQKYFILSDGLGSVAAVADANGNIKERAIYHAYGKPVFIDAQTGQTLANSQIPGNIYSYTGREYDAETGLFYYRARYYDADAGRFIQKDPIGFEGGDVNLYAYVGNNPINLTDSFGLVTCSSIYRWFNPRDWPNFAKAQKIAKQVLEESKKLPGSHKGIGDAWRHAEWNRRMTEEIGWGTAFIAGWGHELGEIPDQPLNEMIMDLHNNAVGRGLAGTGKGPFDVIPLLYIINAKNELDKGNGNGGIY